MTRKLTIAERFEKRISCDDNGCWIWTGAIKNGYGVLSLGKRKCREYAHRYSYASFIAPVSDGLFVCHTCDNPRCCNPAHLFLGTQKDNLRDMRAKGRGFPLGKGEQHSSARLTQQQVREIRAAREMTTAAGLSRLYGVTPQHISQICSRKKWANT